MRKFLQYINHKVLSSASIFEIQQKLCNNYTAVMKEFSSYLDLSNLVILDVGCSTGTCAASIIDMKRNSYYGIDVNSEYVHRAARFFPMGNWEAMDARKMRFPSNKFDVVMYIGVLHHMPDSLAIDCLLETKRVLKNDGRILIAEPVFTSGWLLSNFLLSIDRGKNIRSSIGYKALFNNFRVEREHAFKFSIHQFCSFVLQ